MNKPVTETELLNHSKAPRVTEPELDANMVAINFFNAGQAAEAQDQPATDSMKLLTICVITLANGFTVVGKSACASAENYDEGIGQRLAFHDARNQVWALMGYHLRQKLLEEDLLLGSRAFTEDRDQAVYIGTKVVHAFPLTRGEYNLLRGWTLPADENGDDEGYVVEYTDRVESPPHVPNFKGYVSWSPKDVFENAYRQVGGTRTV